MDDFKIIMAGRCDDATKVAWQSILTDKILRSEISEFCKLAEILLCIPIGSVQNERAFSQMNLIKSDLRNSLGPKHLNACMRARRSKHTVKTLPVERVVKLFLAKKKRRSVNAVVNK